MLMRFSPLALTLLAKTTRAGAMVALQILRDFDANNENYGPMTRAALPIQATTINEKVMGLKSMLKLSYNKPDGAPHYVDVTLSGSNAIYERQMLSITRELPAALVDGFVGRMLSDVTPLPGFETMPIIAAEQPKFKPAKFTAGPPETSEHDIEAVVGKHDPVFDDASAGFKAAMDARSQVIIDILNQDMPDIAAFLDPLIEHVFLVRTEDDAIRLSENWSLSGREGQSIGLRSYAFDRIDSNAAKESARAEILEAVRAVRGM